MSRYSGVAAYLLSFESRDLGTGASDDEIAAAEQALGVRIEGGYRQFLTQFGWGGVEDVELFGLGAGVPPFLDLVRLTKSGRSETQPYLPHHLLPVMNDGAGNQYCLDTRVADEPPIVCWSHEAGTDQTPDVESRSLTSWLGRLLDDIP